MATDRTLELESFLATVPGMIYRSRLSPAPYTIESVSDAMTSIAGYPVGDFVGSDPKRNWSELIHPEDVEASRATVHGAPADGSVNEAEYRVRRAEGTCAWILSRFRKVVGEDGSLYFTLAKGLTNVAKYAGATGARVGVRVRDGAATAEISDDGRGGANASGGSGLRGLADPAQAIGGSLQVESPPGGGTVLRARVPLG